MKFLALDIGTKRIGVATCDRMELAATPHSVIPADRGAPRTVVDLIAAEGVEGIVLGMPYSLDGKEREACALVRAFIEKLRPLVGIPIDIQDERLTTKIAEASLIETGYRRERRKELRDAVSAALILQSFLDRRRHEREKGVPPP